MSYGVGIDVSKSWLDVHVHGLGHSARFGNTPVGYARLLAWLSPHALRLVVLEATGGYEQAALDALHAAGLPMVRLNPRQARDFAKATGLTLDLTTKGMGLRSNRYSMLVRDGKVVTLNVEAPGKFEVSDADTLLAQAKA